MLSVWPSANRCSGQWHRASRIYRNASRLLNRHRRHRDACRFSIRRWRSFCCQLSWNTGRWVPGAEL